MKKVLILCMFLLGCSSEKIPSGMSGVDASALVGNAAREEIEQTIEISEATGEITGHLDLIDGEANGILNDIAVADPAPDPLISGIENRAERIIEVVHDSELEMVRVDEALEDLHQANDSLTGAIGMIESLENEVAEYAISDRELRKDAIENLYAYITIFFVVGFAMIVGGAFLALFVSGRAGATVLGIGILTVGFATASQYYLEEIATIGLIVFVIGFLATAGIITSMLLKGKKTEQAMEEIIELIEEMKAYLSPEEREKIFGPGGVASEMTTDLTKEIVSQIKIKKKLNKAHVLLDRKSNQ